MRICELCGVDYETRRLTRYCSRKCRDGANSLFQGQARDKIPNRFAKEMTYMERILEINESVQR